MLIIFDKDGVLLNTEQAKIRSYWQAIQDILLSERAEEESVEAKNENWPGYKDWHYNNLTGKSRVKVVQEILSSFPSVRLTISNNSKWLEEKLRNTEKEKVVNELESDRFSSKQERILSAFRMKHYSKMSLRESTNPIKELLELIPIFYNHCDDEVQLALITESESARTMRELKVCNVDITSFKVIACKDRIIKPINERRIKNGGPKEEMYEKIMDIAKSDPEHTFAIEDTEKGRKKALKAGIKCFQVYFP